MKGTRILRGERTASDPAAGADRIREIVAARARDVLEARRRVLRRCDGEAIHDLRVATRRLQSTLEIAADRLPDRARRRLDRRARRIRRTLGEQRNAWVLLGLLRKFRSVPDRGERKFVADLTRRLEHSAGSHTPKHRGRLPGIRKRVRALLRVSANGPGGAAAPEGGAMRGLVQAILRARADARDGDAESMHRLRIAVKRYRYALEVLSETGIPGLQPAIRAARSLQGDLGRLHDLDVLIEAVRRESRLPGATGFLRRIQRLRSRQVEGTLRRLAGFRPVFALPGGGGVRPHRAGGKRGPFPRENQAGRTAA